METTRGPVLIVEDHADSAQMLCDFLSFAEVPCVTAGDGRAALAALHAHRPCLILLDLMMPKMDGFSFREAQQALPDRELATIPIVALTAMPGHRDHAARMGAVASLQKPVDLDRLLALVRDYCGPSGASE
jgi:CheY-like chemotaxis protein